MRTPHKSLAASLLAVATIFAACTGNGGGTATERATPTPSPSPSPTPEPTGALILARGSEVLRYDIGDDQRELITVRGENHAVSPDGTRIVYEVPVSPDEFPNPQLELVEVDNPYEIRVLGQGYSPIWSPDSELVAAMYLEVGSAVCAVEEGRIPRGEQDERGCTEMERVNTFDGSADDSGRSPEWALGQDLWRVLGWTDGERILARSRIDGHAALGAPGASDAEIETVQAPRWRVRDVSPVEPLLLVQRPRGVFLKPASEGEEEVGLEVRRANRVRLDLPDGARVVDSAFSPDGAHVALIVETEDLPPRVVLAETETGWVSPEITFVADPRGPLLWHEDESHFAFVAAGELGTGSRVVVCALDLYCREVHSAGRSITLLWFDPGELRQIPETPRS